MKKLFVMVAMLMVGIYASACTNFIVGKKASTDGSVICTYDADDYGMFINLCHFAAGAHAKGEMRKIHEWDTGKYLGEIPEAPYTYNVIGNINEFQVTIAETTFGGRPEMQDETGILDYGSLIYVALQRSKTACEAIEVMTSLTEKYGFYSSGETFTICDPNEAWIMEMMGTGKGSKGVVWVAVRVPDDCVAAHANQSRIRKFLQYDTEVKYSKNCIKYARKMGWFDGKDKDFSFCDTYAAPDFGGRRFCDARVWSFYNHFRTDMDQYLTYAMGKVPYEETTPMPLYMKPDRKVSVHDIMMCMRDHYEGTPMRQDDNIGGGMYNMPYRPTPLTYKHNGKEYFNERATSTQQSGFTFVSQMREWLPREIGGVLWFGNDDANMIAYTPIYCSSTVQPECYNTPGADAVTFSFKNAFWVCNWVSNMVYPRYSQLFPSLQQVRDELEGGYLRNQANVEKKAMELYKQDPAKAVKYLNDYGIETAQGMLDRWNDLAKYLIVKFNDMAVKPEKDGKFLWTPDGKPARVERPGMPAEFVDQLIKQTGDKYLCPESK